MVVSYSEPPQGAENWAPASSRCHFWPQCFITATDSNWRICLAEKPWVPSSQTLAVLWQNTLVTLHLWMTGGSGVQGHQSCLKTRNSPALQRMTQEPRVGAQMFQQCWWPLWQGCAHADGARCTLGTEPGLFVTMHNIIRRVRRNTLGSLHVHFWVNFWCYVCKPTVTKFIKFQDHIQLLTPQFESAFPGPPLRSFFLSSPWIPCRASSLTDWPNPRNLWL